MKKHHFPIREARTKSNKHSSLTLATTEARVGTIPPQTTISIVKRVTSRTATKQKQIIQSITKPVWVSVGSKHFPSSKWIWIICWWNRIWIHCNVTGSGSGEKQSKGAECNTTKSLPKRGISILILGTFDKLPTREPFKKSSTLPLK